MKILYEEMRPEEFLESLNEFPVAYLPLGTLEWHGLHMPLGADGLQAKGIMEKIATKIGGIVLPMLFLGPDFETCIDGKAYYGMDYFSFEEGKSQQLEGSSYYIEKELFVSMLDRIMQNLARAGFKVVVAHGHGPSTNTFAEQKKAYAEKYGLQVYNLWDLGYKEKDGIMTDHAAANETSLVLALHPELVDMNKLQKYSVPVGSWGEDPRTGASEERGKILIEKNVELASKKLQEIVKGISFDARSMNYHDVKSLLGK